MIEKMMMQSQHGAMAQQQQPTAAPSNNNAGILDSLPPIVPSAGYTVAPTSTTAPSSSAANNPNKPSSATTTPSTSPTKATKNIPPTIKLGNRLILTSKPTRKWAWKSFTSSARSDNATFSHWVRSSVEYADYPYARFDVHLEPLQYTNEEYEQYFDTDKGVVVKVLEGLGEEYDLVTGERKRKRVVDSKKEGGSGDKKQKNDKQLARYKRGRQFLRSYIRNADWVKHYPLPSL